MRIRLKQKQKKWSSRAGEEADEKLKIALRQLYRSSSKFHSKDNGISERRALVISGTIPTYDKRILIDIVAAHNRSDLPKAISAIVFRLRTVVFFSFFSFLETTVSLNWCPHLSSFRSIGSPDLGWTGIRAQRASQQKKTKIPQQLCKTWKSGFISNFLLVKVDRLIQSHWIQKAFLNRSFFGLFEPNQKLRVLNEPRSCGVNWKAARIALTGCVWPDKT